VSELVLVVFSLLSIVAWVYFWRKVGPDRKQLFDPKRVRTRWAEASPGRRVATVLSIPIGIGLGILVVKAQESGTISEVVTRGAMLVLIIFLAHRVSNRLKDERSQGDEPPE
jgi:hypothetical protein